MTFNEFNFKEQLQKAIDDAGFKEPSPIQEQAIPFILVKVKILLVKHIQEQVKQQHLDFLF